jgi:tRNA pseudouridine38-40 synthase
MQKQKSLELKTIQGLLERAISQFANEQIEINYSGRTDSGVHAIGQVIDFVLRKEYKIESILMGINFYLQNEKIRVLHVKNVEMNFDSRFSAKERVYLYKIINRQPSLSFQKGYFTYVKWPLNVSLMRECAKILEGKHDFSAFRSSECQAANAIRTINKIEIVQISDEELHFYFHAKSFLHNMIRIIMGLLIEIGAGKKDKETIARALNCKDRSLTAFTAPADGLYFYKVIY